MRKRWLYATGLVCLMAACTGTPQSSADGLCSIDVAGAMEKPAELKLSELGSDVRYVLLETTDSCLIGGNPNILLLDKQIAVVSGKNCFLFDKETGKFLVMWEKIQKHIQDRHLRIMMWTDCFTLCVALLPCKSMICRESIAVN